MMASGDVRLVTGNAGAAGSIEVASGTSQVGPGGDMVLAAGFAEAAEHGGGVHVRIGSAALGEIGGIFMS